MPRSPARFFRYPLMLAVAGALAFGARSAAAGIAPVSWCPYNPPDGYFSLSCTPGPDGNSYCDSRCKVYVGDWSAGSCGYPGYRECCLCEV